MRSTDGGNLLDFEVKKGLRLVFYTSGCAPPRMRIALKALFWINYKLVTSRTRPESLTCRIVGKNVMTLGGEEAGQRHSVACSRFFDASETL